jgi:peptidoglycan/LPS O-acetylase OafA/YrhL
MVKAWSDQTNPKPYLYGLDILRLTAAGMVMAFHLTERTLGWNEMAPIGWVGVQIFFVISGFVIINSAEGAGPLKFARSRILRLYPVAWGCALVSVLALVVFGQAYAVAGIRAGLSITGVVGSLLLVRIKTAFLASAYWTLPVEIAFYVLVGALLIRGPIRPLQLGAGLIAWSMLYFSACVPKWLGVPGAPDLNFEYGVLNVTLWRYGFYFGIGVLMSDLSRRLFGPLHMGLLALGAGMAVIEIAWRAEENARLFTGAAKDPIVLGTWALLAWLLSLGWIGLSIRFNGRAPSKGGAAAIRMGGLLTYPVYLLHETVGGSIEGWLIGRGTPFALAFLAAVAVTLLAALAVVRFWEKPARRIMEQVFDGGFQRRLQNWRSTFAVIVR